VDVEAFNGMFLFDQDSVYFVRTECEKSRAPLSCGDPRETHL
jgi:hypothetical protein